MQEGVTKRRGSSMLQLLSSTLNMGPVQGRAGTYRRPRILNSLLAGGLEHHACKRRLVETRGEAACGLEPGWL